MSEATTPRGLPASGAWRAEDPVGRRQFLHVGGHRPFVLDFGGVLPAITIAYETWGQPNTERSNAVLLCHAWTGDSHATGPASDGHPTPGWWEGLVGPGRAIDTERYFVVCANVLGGCQGSTGPASIDSSTARPYGPRFPVVTVRDMVRAQALLADALDVACWHAVVGGSMGGMQALEWAVMYPDRLRGVAAIATCATSSAQQIAWGSIGRRAIRLDPRWRGGDYYDAPDDDGPWEGLAIARMVSQVTFRSDNVLTERFGRDLTTDGDGPLGLWDRFEVERYLDHHGEKLVRRFDANSYLVLGKAMDLHDLARGRGSLEGAMGRVRARALVAGITSDVLYPLYQQAFLHEHLDARGAGSEFVEVDSPHGHDAFLLEHEQLGAPLARFLERLSPAGRLG